MTWARAGFVGAVVAGLLLLGGPADAAGKGKESKAGDAKAQQVRDYLDKATAAFALNRYAVAAENYEKAFELKPDPAVLYNAAQAYRLAGNKERALELYQSYLRMYGAEKRAEVEKHIENLKQAIEKDHAVATSPPTTPAPVGTTIQAPPPPPEPATPGPEPAPPVPAKVESPPTVPTAPPLAQKPAEQTPVLVTQASPPPDDGSIVKKPWFWIVVGGAVVAAAVGGFLLFRPGPSDPTGSLPPLSGN